MAREEDERRRFAFGEPGGTVEGIDVTLLDPDDEDERRLLILAEHPDLQPAIASGRREIRRGGEVIHPGCTSRCT